MAITGKLTSSGFSSSSVVKNLLANAGDVGSISGSGRCPGRGSGGTWWDTVHGVARV